MLTLPFRLVGRLGPLGRVVRPLCGFATAWWALPCAHALSCAERIFELETNERVRGAMMRDVLLELDGELQRQEHRLGQQAEHAQQQQQTLAQHAQQSSEFAHRLSEQERHQPALFSAYSTTAAR